MQKEEVADVIVVFYPSEMNTDQISNSANPVMSDGGFARILGTNRMPKKRFFWQNSKEAIWVEEAEFPLVERIAGLADLWKRDGDTWSAFESVCTYLTRLIKLSEKAVKAELIYHVFASNLVTALLKLKLNSGFSAENVPKKIHSHRKKTSRFIRGIIEIGKVSALASLHLERTAFRMRLGESTTLVLQAWKQSDTVLIYKKGKLSDPANWRPISLQAVIHKVYSAALAKQLLSTEPIEGCAEHVQKLRQVIHEAKNYKHSVSVAFLDLESTFGSVPHEMIRLVLSRFGVPEDLESSMTFTQVRQRLYELIVDCVD
ncbi:hypothetical protein L596_004205 [Steinernema carpocapsae]|uniref:Reverse transcriptase domain-containing protein n=1 Tax=Steinernema carpocapsae TaxID=34508 RepID=A0A4U8UV01_STECR|nr:hypothetical protein L596_004205 [Steinernema carpocapsae]